MPFPPAFCVRHSCEYIEMKLHGVAITPMPDLELNYTTTQSAHINPTLLVPALCYSFANYAIRSRNMLLVLVLLLCEPTMLYFI